MQHSQNLDHSPYSGATQTNNQPQETPVNDACTELLQEVVATLLGPYGKPSELEQYKTLRKELARSKLREVVQCVPPVGHILVWVPPVKSKSILILPSDVETDSEFSIGVVIGGRMEVYDMYPGMEYGGLVQVPKWRVTKILGRNDIVSIRVDEVQGTWSIAAV